MNWRAFAPAAALIGATAAFQIGAALAKTLFPVVGPQGAAALRLVLASVMLLALVRPWRRWPVKAPLLPLAGLGVSMAGVILSFYFAIARLPLGAAIALQFLGPLAIAIFDSRKASDLIWAVLAGAGVLALVAPGTGGRALDPLGVAWALAAAALWASYILFGRPASRAFGGATPALSLTLAALIVAPVGLQHAGAMLVSPAVLPMALVVAVFAAAIPFSLEIYALPRLPARTFAVFTSLEPAFGAIVGYFILGEALPLSQAMGVLAVVGAAAGSGWSNAGEAEPAGAPPA